MRKNFVEELRWRGMLAQIMPGTEELLQKEMVTAYLGTDPTADSLHIGHLCGIMMLRHLQRCGHKPIILVGGATGMIGDPSGKSQERNLLNDETLRHNQECIKAQVAKFLDFESKDANAAEMVNNYDWMKNFTFLDFAREVGKHITVNYMMAKESVQQRLNGTARDGLSFTEFTYQLLQGYDFLYLYQHKGVKLQLGGNASSAYGIIALVVAILSPLFVMFTLLGVKENRDDMEKPADRVSFKLIAETIFGNDQLRWMVLIYLLHQIAICAIRYAPVEIHDTL